MQYLGKPPGEEQQLCTRDGSEVSLLNSREISKGFRLWDTTPIPRLLSFAWGWLSDLPGLLLREAHISWSSIKAGFRRPMGLLRRSTWDNGVMPWRSSS